MKLRMHIACCFSLILLALQAQTENITFAARVTTELIAVTGDTSPGGYGTFNSFNTPALNDANKAAFFASVSSTNGGSDYSGLFRSDIASGLVEVARRDQIAPDGNGFFTAFEDFLLTDTGDITFLARLNGTSGGSSDTEGIFRGDGTSSVVQIARTGDSAPDGNGSFSNIDFNIAANDAGQVAFFSVLADTSGNNDHLGLFISDGNSGPSRVVRAGETAPDGNGTFSFFYAPAMNESGQVAFRGILTGTTGGARDEEGIFLGDGISTPLQIARGGDPAPNGNGEFYTFGEPALNDVGQAAFVANFLPESTRGIFRGDANSGPIRIAREGDASPDGNGILSSFNRPTVNNDGQVAFVGGLNFTSGGASDAFGVFRGDGTSNLLQIVRKGDVAPDENGKFFDFKDLALVDGGQVAFYGELTDTSGGSSDDRGIYVYDDIAGLTQVAREGDEFLDSTISALSFRGNFRYLGDERSGLNESAQIAFRFQLADGRFGIAISSINPSRADTDGDGDIDGTDFLALQRVNPDELAQWQIEYGTESVSAYTAPEPNSVALAGLTVALIGRGRQSGRYVRSC